MISYASQYAFKNELNIDFQTGDAEKLEFEDNTFDVVVSDGFWMNYTWKLIHHPASKLLKGIFQNGNIISLRFFYSYARFQKMLPFYEGICFEQASRLLQSARFKDIRSYDTSCFDMNPYGGNNRPKNTEPSFFIAYAKS